MSRCTKSLWAAGSLFALQIMLAAWAQAPASGPATDCGPVREITDSSGLLDYRLRFVDARVQSGIGNVNRYHTEPARRALAATPRNRSIMADLDFTLRHSPNHADALRLLMDYQHRGGQIFEFSRFECYFVWALEYTPDDAAVVHLGAQYYWKAGNPSVAEELFRDALKTDPESAELNYNAGLFYFNRKNYEKAREHARIAYAAGYPLPGLRNMLVREKQWTDD